MAAGALAAGEDCEGILHSLTARGESLVAFDGRCIPTGSVAPRSNTPGILGRRALPAGRLTRLGATPEFHRGLLIRETSRFPQAQIASRGRIVACRRRS